MRVSFSPVAQRSAVRTSRPPYPSPRHEASMATRPMEEPAESREAARYPSAPSPRSTTQTTSRQLAPDGALDPHGVHLVGTPRVEERIAMEPRRPMAEAGDRCQAGKVGERRAPDAGVAFAGSSGGHAAFERHAHVHEREAVFLGGAHRVAIVGVGEEVETVNRGVVRPPHGCCQFAGGGTRRRHSRDRDAEEVGVPGKPFAAIRR